MLTVADQITWDALPEETKELARKVLGADELSELQWRVQELESDLGTRDSMQLQAVQEIMRVNEALDNMQTLFSNSMKDTRTMLRGLQSRLAL